MTRVDWIDYRASVGRVHRRAEAGGQSLTCPDCGTETDVGDVVHSPRCKHLGAGVLRDPSHEIRATSAAGAPAPATEGRDLLEQMDRGERIAAPAPTSEGEIMPDVVCKVDGCDGDASSAPKAGPTARLCPVHRVERGREISAARALKKAARSATAQPAPASNGNGSVVVRAERLLTAARAVDELEALLEQARAELKQAAAAIG